MDPDAESVTNTTRVQPWALVVGIVAALALFFACYIYPADSSLVLYPILVAPFVAVLSLAVVVWVIFPRNRRHRWTWISALLAFWLTSIPLFWYEASHPLELRGEARWLVESRKLKQQVLASGRGQVDELKSIDWDGWGAFAQNTEVYLVFDPADSLAEAARKHQAGKFAGIPCEVQDVRRLEDHWYSVVFYTSQTWGHCGDSAP